MIKDDILQYLQENGLKLHEKVPGLISAKFVDDPPRLVLTVTKSSDKIKQFADVLDFRVEVEVNEEAEGNSIDEGDPNLKAWRERHKGVVLPDGGLDSVQSDVAFLPERSEAKDQEAYEKWVKRHANVKIEEK